MGTFKYDGKEIPFEPGETIIKAAWRQGIEIPHYCWHPGLSAPANCRMCLVEILPAANQRAVMLDIVELDKKTGEYMPVKKPKLLPACQMPAQDGIEVKGDTSPHVHEARKGVQEFLLLNHPVDCPICDQSGECKLQDYWLEHGQYQKRMRDEPVHKPKAVSFGPTIVYDAERCVMCTRCIRFMEEVAQDPVLDMRERGNLNEIAVAPGRELDGHYTFMTEHVCPVGALTTKDFRFKARVWFLKTANSVCQGCATGCNTHLDYDPRYNKAYRYRPRDNEAVNQFWMCDEGMVSYKLAHDERIIEPRLRKPGKSETTVASPKKALAEAAKLLGQVPTSALAVVFSAQHSLEDNWALKELATTLFGTKALYVSGASAGYEDKILIHKDKNSNTRGVLELVGTDAAHVREGDGLKGFRQLVADIEAGRVTHVLALGGAAPGDLEQDVIALAPLGALVTIAAHEGALALAAHVVLPAASWAESSGTFVNAKGMKQIADKALEPQGTSRPAWEQLAELARAMGLDAGWTRLKQIRERLAAAEAPAAPPAAAAPPAQPVGGANP